MSRKIHSGEDDIHRSRRPHSINKNSSTSSLSRTPSSVLFSRSSSSNSLPAQLQASNNVSQGSVTYPGTKTTPQEGKKNSLLPASFTVSSSMINVNNKPPARALNPAAKEFEFPVNGACSYLYGGVTLPDPKTTALFAMPSQRRVVNTAVPVTGIASDYTTSWSVSGAGRQPRSMVPCNSLEHPVPSTFNAQEAIVEKLMTHIRMTYMHKCKEQKLHMVSVLNLECHTSHKCLLDMFSAMGACEATVLDVNDLPYGIVSTNNFIVRRGIGVVFFSEKEFAMLGVEKLNSFVPTGQHQQLIVRYCGPDSISPITTRIRESVASTSDSLKSGSQNHLPWIMPTSHLEKIHEEMRLAFNHLGEPSQFMVAIHGLDPKTSFTVLLKNVMREDTVRCEPWPLKNQHQLTELTASNPWRCRSLSAVIWYVSEQVAKAAVRDLNNRVLDGQQQKVCMYLLGPPRRQHQYFPPKQDVLIRPNAPDERDKILRGANNVNSTVNFSTAFQSKKVSKVGDSFTSPPPFGGFAANDNGTIFAQIEAYFLNKFAKDDYFLVVVHKLDSQTDQKNLHEIFYPNGAIATELYPDLVTVDGKARRSGVALFSSQGMAIEAARRFNDFVPNGQTRPLLTRYLERGDGNYETTVKKINSNLFQTEKKKIGCQESTGLSEAATTEQGATSFRSRGPAGIHCGKNDAILQKESFPFSTPRATYDTLDGLLSSIQNQLSTVNIDAERLEEHMVNLANHPDSSEDTASKLAQLLGNTLVKAKHQSVMLSTPLSGALTGLHDRLGIPKRDSTPTNGTSNDCPKTKPGADIQKKIRFVKQIAQKLLLLVTQKETPPQSRRVAGTLCAYLFPYSYLPENPCRFAVEFLSKCQAELKQAQTFPTRESNATGVADEHNRRRPLSDFIEALDDLTRFWLRNKSRAKSDDYTRRYLILRSELLAENGSLSSVAPMNVVAPKSEKAGKTEGSILSPGINLNHSANKDSISGMIPNRDSMGAPTGHTTQALGSAKPSPGLLTPSARPTPLRVTKNSMTSGSGNRYKQTPVEYVSNSVQALPPRVMLTPASNQTQGVSANISLESNDQISRVHCLASDLNLQGFSIPHAFRSFAGVSGLTAKFNISPASRSITTGEMIDSQVVFNSHGRSALPEVEPKLNAPPIIDMCVPPVVEAASQDSHVINHRLDTSDSTVYITKLPSSFTASQVRRLLLNFGTFTKVRLCHDDKEGLISTAALTNQVGACGKLCFLFVEFVESLSAKAIVEYFRNASHIPNSFDFMRQPLQSKSCGDIATNVDNLTVEQKILTEKDIKLLTATRASPARKPIHDQQYLDAVLRPPTLSEMMSLNLSQTAVIVERECLFGVLMPDLAIENYNSSSYAELRPPLPPTSNNNNFSVNIPSPALAISGKAKKFPSNMTTQPTFFSSGSVVNPAPLSLLLPDTQSTTVEASSLCALDPFVVNNEEDREPDLDIQAFTDAFMGHPTLPTHGVGSWLSKPSPLGVIGDSADGVKAETDLSHSHELSLVGHNDATDDANNLSYSQEQNSRFSITGPRSPSDCTAPISAIEIQA